MNKIHTDRKWYAYDYLVHDCEDNATDSEALRDVNIQANQLIF
jgi:hypothetical protein